jgi:hypothetical protein
VARFIKVESQTSFLNAPAFAATHWHLITGPLLGVHQRERYFIAMNTLATAHLAFVGLVCWGLAMGSPNRFAGSPFPSGQSAPVVSQRIVFEPSEASDFKPVMIFRSPRSHKRLYYTPLSTDLYLELTTSKKGATRALRL